MSLRDLLKGREPGDPLVDASPVQEGEELLTVEQLGVVFQRGGVRTEAVRELSLRLRSGHVLGVAGESGSGKTTAGLAAIGLLPAGASVTGSIKYRDQELVGLSDKQMRAFRGSEIAMVFQETGTALNPVIRVGDQLMTAARAHRSGTRAQLRAQIESALDEVRLHDHDHVMRSYPDELSGGMCQRVVIAMALSCGSKVLLADEPTTALDVSVQREIIELIGELVRREKLAAMMVSHDLGVLTELCDELVVMHMGEVVEIGPVDAVLGEPAHPYTKALLDCLPRLHGDKVVLPELAQYGQPVTSEGGCRFRHRCPLRADLCENHPDLMTVEDGSHDDAPHAARCWRSDVLLAESGSAARLGQTDPSSTPVL
ncbi:MAG TPA: ABC transporter ATP-binding protein [Streptosporangiaceae bacterium]|nr:ABC transporter ATP-binding protein [Streptosporangiaceae bacterium]